MAGDGSVDTAVRPWLFPGPQTTGRAQISELNHLEQWDLAGNLEIYGGLFLVVITIASGVPGTVNVPPGKGSLAQGRQPRWTRMRMKACA